MESDSLVLGDLTKEKQKAFLNENSKIFLTYGIDQGFLASLCISMVVHILDLTLLCLI